MSNCSRTVATRRCGFPREFELPGDEAVIRKEGDRLIIESAPPKSLLAVLATLSHLDEAFPAIPDLPVDSIEL